MVMMRGNPIFVDTNILVYANNKDSNLCEIARQKIDVLSDTGHYFIISDQVIREYLVIMTRPGFIEKPVSGKSVLEDIERMLNEFDLIFPDKYSIDKLMELVEKYDIKGKRIHDVAIVSLMLTKGIKDILTYNVDDFKAFREITIHSI
jgi:predicted nucleic acid-binding protein